MFNSLSGVRLAGGLHLGFQDRYILMIVRPRCAYNAPTYQS